MTARLSIIPAGAVTDRSLEPRDLQVLCLLGRHTDKLGWCFRSQVKMAAELDCGRSSIQRSLERLYEAGWVEKKLRGIGPGTPDPKHPHAAHAYRVRLDRDDLIDVLASDPSYDESAEQGDRCPPVGTPSDEHSATEIDGEGARENGHAGAQPSTGTGCPVMHGHMNDPKERPSLERERDARARDRKARGLVDFEARWPTAAADDRQRTAYAWEALDEADEKAAMDGIKPFLENLKRLGRKNVPAGSKYLEEKRWTLLEVKKPAAALLQAFARGSTEAKAVEVLYTIAGKADVLGKSFMRSSEGATYYRREVTPKLLALATEADQSKWTVLTHNQAQAWNSMLADYVTLEVWTRLAEGSCAPRPWPPRKDGTWSDFAPDTLCTEQDHADFAKLG